MRSVSRVGSATALILVVRRPRIRGLGAIAWFLPFLSCGYGGDYPSRSVYPRSPTVGPCGIDQGLSSQVALDGCAETF